MLHYDCEAFVQSNSKNNRIFFFFLINNNQKKKKKNACNSVHKDLHPVGNNPHALYECHGVRCRGVTLVEATLFIKQKQTNKKPLYSKWVQVRHDDGGLFSPKVKV